MPNQGTDRDPWNCWHYLPEAGRLGVVDMQVLVAYLLTCKETVVPQECGVNWGEGSGVEELELSH